MKEGPRLQLCAVVQGRSYNQEEYRRYAEEFSAAFMAAHPELQEARRTASAAAYSELLEQCYWRARANQDRPVS